MFIIFTQQDKTKISKITIKNHSYYLIDQVTNQNLINPHLKKAYRSIKKYLL